MLNTTLTARARTWVTRRRTPTGILLLYHRIAEPGTDPWSLAISPAQFNEQLSILRRYGTPMGLQEFLRKRHEKSGRERAIVITFDDGYANNLTQAKPLLVRHRIPATVFVTAGMIDHPREFWWDELERLLLLPGTLPSRLELAVNGRVHHWSLGDTAVYTERDYQTYRAWRAWEPCPTERQSLYRSLYELLFPLDEERRRVLLFDLMEWAGVDLPLGRESHRIMTRDEVRMLADDGLVEVGAHSMTHASLGALSPREQWGEIAGGKDVLDGILQKSVTSLAFPFGRPGDYSRETLALVRAAGFTSACTTASTVVQPWADRFELPRLTVHARDRRSFAAWMHDISHQ